MVEGGWSGLQIAWMVDGKKRGRERKGSGVGESACSKFQIFFATVRGIKRKAGVAALAQGTSGYVPIVPALHLDARQVPASSCHFALPNR